MAASQCSMQLQLSMNLCSWGRLFGLLKQIACLHCNSSEGLPGGTSSSGGSHCGTLCLQRARPRPMSLLPSSSLQVYSSVDNVAGVKIPKFESVSQPGDTKMDLTGGIITHMRFHTACRKSGRLCMMLSGHSGFVVALCLSGIA